MLIEYFESICNFFGMYPGEMTLLLMLASLVCLLTEILVVIPIIYLKHRGTLKNDWADLKYVMGVSSAMGLARGLYGKVSNFPSTFLILRLLYQERIRKSDAGAKGKIKHPPVLAGRARKRRM